MDRTNPPRQQTGTDASTTSAPVDQPTEVRLVNLCPHDVVVVLDHGQLVLRPDGPPARCVVERVHAGDIRTDGWTVPVVESRVVQAPVLPDERSGILLIVSRMVAEAVPDRSDLVFPDGLVRDEGGTVVGCSGFARLA